MPLPEDHPFRRHAANLALVERGLTQCERAHKLAIRRNDIPTIQFLARIHMFMVGVMAEARLRKAAWDPSGFNARERALILDARSQLERWLRAVELAFRRHYSVPIHLEVHEAPIGAALVHQYESLNNVLHYDLEPVIGDRNDIAHGQWKWLLNAKETAVTGEAQQPMNYLQIHRRAEAVRALGSLIHTLAVSEPTFQHDYETLYAKIQTLHDGFGGADYAVWASTLAHPPLGPVAVA